MYRINTIDFPDAWGNEILAVEKEDTTMSASEVVFKAVEVAARAHAGQFRKGTNMPYIVHPIGVLAILLEAGCSDAVAAAGVLHDVLEDTPITIAKLRAELGDRALGDRIAELVEGATTAKMPPWRERKESTITKVKETSDSDLLLVMCADKLDNIRAIRRDYEKVGEALWARFNGSGDDLKWYYTTLAAAFASRLKAQPGLQLATELRTEVDKMFARQRADRSRM
jgi:(p)ppGpp synthase/HD superfamily hydrolase